jgi:RNA polymerase sigma factor (sigma-70 family)
MEPPYALFVTDTNRDISATVSREAGKLAAFIEGRVRNTADAEDILQEVFLEFVQAYRLPEPIEQISAWLFRVARNRIIDRFRKKKTQSFSESIQDRGEEGGGQYLDLEIPSPEGGPEAEIARLAILEALQQALGELPVGQREVFVAHEIEGLSFESLSRRGGIPVNTLLSRKRYAVLYLRRRLQTLYDELDKKESVDEV